MFKTTVNKEYRNDQLAKIHKKNNRLHQLVSGEFQTQILEAVRPQSKAEHIHMTQAAARHTSIYNTIQRQAKDLHILLQQKLKASAYRCCQVNFDFPNAGYTGLELTPGINIIS